jgi:uncharacterized Tic20 family protein
VSFEVATTSENDRSYATFQHVVPLVAHLGGPIVVPIIAAVIMWQIKKQQPFLDDHGREATNFQISMAIYWIASLVVIPIIAVLTCGIGALLYIPLLILNVYGCVRGAMAANKGEYFRYPMCLRLV